jgi:hypothetical protein
LCRPEVFGRVVECMAGFAGAAVEGKLSYERRALAPVRAAGLTGLGQARG